MTNEKKFSTWEVIRLEFKGKNKALKLQAKEYKRRLTTLNHEAKQLRKMQSTYVPREVNDRVIENLHKEIEELQTFKYGIEAKKSLEKYIPWIIAAVSTGYAIFKK